MVYEALIGAGGTIVGVLIMVLVNLRINKNNEIKRNKDKIISIECTLIESIYRRLDEKVFGAMFEKVAILIPREGPSTEKISINEVYTNIYRLRNLSERHVENFLLQSRNGPPSIWFMVYEADNPVNPDWDKRNMELLNQYKDDKTDGWDSYPIPYINPYKQKENEVLVKISSYSNLKGIEIVGSSPGIKFIFKSSE